VTLVVKLETTEAAPCCWNLPSAVTVAATLTAATPDLVLAPSADTAAVVAIPAVAVLVLAPATVVVETTDMLEPLVLITVASRTGVKKYPDAT
jgi:hypothetical protein